MTINNIILILFGIIISVVAINAFEVKISREKSKFSFKEAMDLVDLPILTFQVGGERLNFLLDTGADESHIAAKFAPLLKAEPIRSEQKNVIGANGCALSTSGIYNVTLTYKDNKFEATLIATELAPLDELKRLYGVQVHGILGTEFFKKYKYVLDFAELVAYIK